MSNRSRHPLDSDPAWQSHGESDTPPPPRWPSVTGLWQRLAQGLRPGKQTAADERSSGELTTLPGASRGHMLREAHRGLRALFRQEQALRQVLPHLYFVERSMARRGSMALMDVPVLVLQRALQQLDRAPLGGEDGGLDLAHLQILRYRLAEAIGLRSRHLVGSGKGKVRSGQDSFNGALDTRPSTRAGLSTLPGGLDVTEVPQSLFDEVVEGRHPPLSETGSFYRRR
jgi:hypothetical protein